MDTGKGYLAPIHSEVAENLRNLQTKGAPSVFQVGEELEIKNSRFKIVNIGI